MSPSPELMTDDRLRGLDATATVQLVAPAAMGKHFIVERAIELDPAIRQTPILVANLPTEQQTTERRHTIGLIASPGAWQQWFDRRYRSSSTERSQRLAEAALSLDWLLEQTGTTWLINEEGESKQTARELVALTRGETTGSNPNLAYAYAQRLTQLIPTLRR